MKPCYPSPHDNSGEFDAEIEGKMYFNIGYYFEPPEQDVGFRGYMEVDHPAIGYIVDATPYQIKNRQKLEDKIIEAAEKYLNDQAESDFDEYRR